MEKEESETKKTRIGSMDKRTRWLEKSKRTEKTQRKGIIPSQRKVRGKRVNAELQEK